MLRDTFLNLKSAEKVLKQAIILEFKEADQSFFLSQKFITF